ncbi:hypothetical protein A0H81_05695 [Grifola frondosa]|uniref:Guanine nucleotide-binding protein alpha-2 subunit n=1 Tax=Grifola frondosa TaxID=5627 RepID=A0A1C7MIB9_GRIFR|nr:hypothetical protein A0H81_05695 [Grifola frondosa]
MSAAWDVYAEQLFFLKHGLPLWAPEPTNAGEVLIGDVGYVYNGGFYRLFNTQRSADDGANQLFGVPDKFEPFSSPQTLTQLRYAGVNQPELYRKSITSLNVSAVASARLFNLSIYLIFCRQIVASAGGSFRYKCTDERGALLLLKKPGDAVINHAKGHIVDYMRLNHASWCNFTNSLGLSRPDEDIIFISGHVKTAEWTVAAYTNRSREGELSFIGDFGPSASASASLSMSHSVSMSVQYRSGPPQVTAVSSRLRLPPVAGSSEDYATPSPSSLGGSVYDQCIFMNYYKMKRRALVLRTVLQAAANTYSDVEVDSIEEVPDIGRPYDPVQYLLDYILDNSDAEIAIACDRDFMHICQDEDIPVNIPVMLKHLAPVISVDDHGVGTIETGVQLSREIFVSPHTISASNSQQSTVPISYLSHRSDPDPNFCPNETMIANKNMADEEEVRDGGNGNMVIKVLLLGQGESGKSTALKQFQLLHSPATIDAERASWRTVIHLNLVSSIRRILEAIASNNLTAMDEQAALLVS